MKSVWILVSIFAISNAEPPVNQECSCNNPGGFQNGPTETSEQKYGAPGGETTGQPVGLTQPEKCPPSEPEANKRFVLQAYQEVFGDHNLTNLEVNFHEDYIQHNPLVSNGREGLRQAILGPLGQGPPFKIDFKRVGASDDLVWTHSRLPLLGKVYATVDIFRIECGKIKEHWDVLQDIDIKMKSANPQPFF